MRIALVDNLPEGGAKRVLWQQIAALSEKHEIFLATNLVQSRFERTIPKIQVHRYLLEIERQRGIKRPWQEWQLFFQLRYAYLSMKNDIKAFGPDLVLCHPDRYTQAPWILRLVAYKTIYFAEEWFRTFWEPGAHPLPNGTLVALYEQIRRWLIARLDVYLARGASKVVTTSAFNQSHFKRAYGITAEVMPLGVDTKLFSPKRLNKKAEYFLFVGEKDKIHGYDLVEEAMALSSGRLVVRTVQFKGLKLAYDDEEMVQLYRGAAAVLCLDSNEPFGLVALEAGACGVPVIAVDEGGYRETVLPGVTGYLVERDGKALYKAMMRLATDEQERLTLGKAARKQAVSKYSLLQFNRHIDELVRRQF